MGSGLATNNRPMNADKVGGNYRAKQGFERNKTNARRDLPQIIDPMHEILSLDRRA